MNSLINHHSKNPSEVQDRFGLKVAAHLSYGNESLPHDISERLRISRQQAVAKHALRTRTALATASSIQTSGNTATLSFDTGGTGLWGRFASVLPLVVLVAGLFILSGVQTDQRAADSAEVDAAILTDSLPASAYTDAGFVQFLKIKTNASNALNIGNQELNTVKDI